MAGERLIYTTALGLCGLVYLVWGEWLLWILFSAVLGLPWISLILSIPAIAAFRTVPTGPKYLTQGEAGDLALLGCCTRPVPPFRGRLMLRQNFTGQSIRYRPEQGIPTDHCGCLRIRVEKARVCDYLGLFAFPVRTREEALVIIRPRSIPGPQWEQPVSTFPGDGIRGEQELRPYRPGDSLKAVHWKLSAKCGSLIFRETCVPQGELPQIRVDLAGTPEDLDRILGQLLWQGLVWLREDRAFSVSAHTGDGTVGFSVRSEGELYTGLDRLLCAMPMGGGNG